MLSYDWRTDRQPAASMVDLYGARRRSAINRSITAAIRCCRRHQRERPAACWQRSASLDLLLRVYKLSVKRWCTALKMQTPHGATKRHLPYWITQCYLPPDTGERARLNPSQIGQYSINLPRRDGRLSWLRRLVTYEDGSPARRQSPIQVLTRTGVE